MAAIGLDPDRLYVGALLHLPAAAVAELDQVQAGDLEDPRLRVVLEIVTELAAAGVAPDPGAVLASAQSSGRVVGGHRVGVLGQLLLALHAEVPTPSSAAYYARAVLDGAMRRRVGQMASRLFQAADQSAVADLLRLAATEYAAVLALAERRHGQHGEVDALTSATGLRVVA